MSKMYFDEYDTNVIVNSVNPQLSAPYQVDYQEIAYKNGGIALGKFKNSRTIDVICTIYGSSSENLIENVDALNNILNVDEPKKLRFEKRWSNRYWNAIPNGSVLINEIRNLALQFEISFLAPDPFAYELTKTENEYNVTDDPSSFTVTSPSGTEYIDLGCQVITTAPEDVDHLIIKNDQTNTEIEYNGTLKENEMLRIDPERSIVEKSTDGGSTWINAMDDVETINWLTLKPGVDNIFTVAGGNELTINTNYRGKYS